MEDVLRLLLLASMASSAMALQPPTTSRSAAASIQVQPVAPSVLATFVTRGGTSELSVLWRGSTKWFLKGNERSSHGGGSGDVLTQTLNYGGVHLDLTYDSQARVATVGQNTVTLPTGSNVLLVDRVDTPDGPSIAGFAQLSFQRDTPGLTIAEVFRQSSAVVEFLRCGDTRGDPSTTVLRSYACDDIDR
jgi:hypothetical protein